jgi:hypothetical protein
LGWADGDAGDVGDGQAGVAESVCWGSEVILFMLVSWLLIDKLE